MAPNFIMLAARTTGRLGPLEIAAHIKNIIENNVDKVYHFSPSLRLGLKRPTEVRAVGSANSPPFFYSKKKDL